MTVLTRRCKGRVKRMNVEYGCPLEGDERCRDGLWRCRRHAAEYREAHPDVTERDAIEQEGVGHDAP